jgi:hypothetical protein
MLSGSPYVTKVEVASTSWSPAFAQYLQDSGQGTNGYSIPRGSNAQSASLTWDNIDQVMITFNEDVIIDAADLSLSGKNVSNYAFSDFHYDPIARVAKWTLAAPLDRDRLRLDLDANGADPVRDLEGNILDGEWTNNVSTISGNGTAGGDFQFNFNVLPTDVNNTGLINNLDSTYINQLAGKLVSSPGYIANRDINGDGIINSVDWLKALARSLQSLPSGSPAGTNNDAPTSSYVNRVEIWDSEINVSVSLLDYFSDIENGGAGLTYSIVSNDNAAVLDVATINQSTGTLLLSAAAGVTGRTNIVVRATDAGGLTVESLVTVDVNRTNSQPQIINFGIEQAGEFGWIISGDVIDDDDVSNFIVEFYGVYVARSAVDENGHFEFAVLLLNGEYGPEYAVTRDPHGLASDVVFDEMGLMT